MSDCLLSICIPAYNRPRQLENLLRSVDCAGAQIEIVICEDCSPGREEIQQRVHAFQTASPYSIVYIENEDNLGYDGNLRRLAAQARGRFLLYMGDDDLFVPRALDRYLGFLAEHSELKYV